MRRRRDRKPRVKPLDGLTAVGKVYDIIAGPLLGVRVVRLPYTWGLLEGTGAPNDLPTKDAIRPWLEGKIGESLAAFGFAFCEAFKYKHLAVGAEYACGINFVKGTTAYRWEAWPLKECLRCAARSRLKARRAAGSRPWRPGGPGRPPGSPNGGAR